MSDVEVEEVAPSGYAVLPKEVTAEIGSVKLFNKWYAQIRGGKESRQLLTILPLQVLRRCRNPRYLLDVRIPIPKLQKRWRIEEDKEG
jgi:hypothetical protein